MARHQLVALGLQPHDVRRLVRRRELAPVHRGVYVTHTGEPSWRQRAWAAVLYAHPAALWGPSALAVAHRRRTPPAGPVHVAVDETRRVVDTPGVVVHRVTGLQRRAHWRANPPRMRTEEAALDAALSARDDFGLVAVLAEAVQERVVTPAQLQAAAAARTRLPRRSFVDALVDDLATGTDSVLEHGYLVRVERAHGLPVGQRQSRIVGQAERRDVRYEVGRVLVELDSRAFHALARQRYVDLERDVAAAAAGYQTVRIGWGQVYSTPCRTAAHLVTLLRQRGWTGTPRPCGGCRR